MGHGRSLEDPRFESHVQHFEASFVQVPRFAMSFGWVVGLFCLVSARGSKTCHTECKQLMDWKVSLICVFGLTTDSSIDAYQVLLKPIACFTCMLLTL